jgi:U3 small nucleolar RNA-associated protein 21
LLAAGGSAGVVALWNLEQRCLHHVVRDAHDAPLLGLHFFAGEPRLMSSGADNSIKQWVSHTDLGHNGCLSALNVRVGGGRH